MPRQTSRLIAAFASVALTLAPLSPALAGNMGGGGHGSTPNCPDMGGHGGGHGGGSNINININKNINIFKPVNINKNININKNVIINKNIVINKVNAIATAQASAFATAAGAAQAGAAAQTIVYSGSYQIINYSNRGAGGAIAIAAVHGGGACHMQEATVVKSIHAVCVSFEGREYAASHMIGDTWIDSGYEARSPAASPART
ncbi:MAG: hypothetical protein WDM81_11985 [Rhizomicrobium sp.]